MKEESDESLNTNNNNKQFFINQIVWIGIAFGIILANSKDNNNASSLKYFCISCGTEHKQAACPKCGSKIKKVGL